MAERADAGPLRPGEPVAPVEPAAPTEGALHRDGEEAEAARLEAGRLLFAQSCRFLLGVAGLAQLPDEGLPEVAFAGRSNVGKSSLVNALTGRKALAKTSNTPGRTQQLNYFNLGGRFFLVDLPGYGYARAPRRQVNAWTQLVQDYLRGRVLLRRVCLLLDSRHGIKASDEAVMAQLDRAAVSYRVVLTKGDKPSAEALDAVVDQVTACLRRHPAALPAPIVTSANKGLGVPALRADIADLLAPHP